MPRKTSSKKPQTPAVQLPEKLLQIFDSWERDPSKSQFSQYGPMDKYFNIMFPDAMVKPQGILRSRIDNLQEAEERADDPKVSFDSYGMGYYRGAETPKKYPDFIVASYYPMRADRSTPADKVRLVVEIASLGDREVATADQKKDLREQLVTYCIELGNEGDIRWHRDTLGVGIIGNEVCYSYPRKVPSKGGKASEGDRTTEPT